MTLEVGKMYVVKGEGEAVLASLPSKWGNVEMLFHEHIRNYVSRDDLVREATGEDVRARHAQALPRKVACRDEDCWCRPYLLT